MCEHYNGGLVSLHWPLTELSCYGFAKQLACQARNAVDGGYFVRAITILH